MREPADLAEWSLHCYCPAARETPHSVVREGTNGRVLYQARDGTTAARLRAAGWDVTEDQVARRLPPRYASGYVRRVRCWPAGSHPGWPRCAARLPGKGWPAARTTWCSDMPWTGCCGLAYMPVVRSRRRLCRRSGPGGTAPFWAVYPGRAGSSGTNFVDCGNSTLVLVWDEAPSSDLNALARAAQLRPAVAAVVAGVVAGVGSGAGAVTDGQGRRWRLRRPDGRPAVPLFGTGGRLDGVAGQVADVVAEALSGREVDPARELVPGGDRAVATVVVAHELIWDVTEALIASGDLRLPQTLVERLYLHANSGSRST